MLQTQIVLNYLVQLKFNVSTINGDKVMTTIAEQLFNHESFESRADTKIVSRKNSAKPVGEHKLLVQARKNVQDSFQKGNMIKSRYKPACSD